ncbi:Uncharacterized protein HZ326_24947 [Fusarium oxysporum f. sp. albedinis]|nr:Uncharacterized protein HZ326_24947 [Fusarium oxysporum f. sp. albedinis]
MAEVANFKEYKIILSGRFRPGYNQHKLKCLISSLPRFSISGNPRELPTHLVCEQAVWDGKSRTKIMKLAMERRTIICNLEWLLDVKDGNREPKSCHILWPEEESVRSRQAEIVRCRQKLTAAKIGGLGTIVESHLEMLDKGEAGKRLLDKSGEKDLLEAMWHLNRVLEIYPEPPSSILEDIEWSVVEDPETARRANSRGYSSIDLQEEVFSHPISIRLYDRYDEHDLIIEVEVPTVRNILTEIGSIYSTANDKWWDLHKKDQNGYMKPRKYDDSPKSQRRTGKEWMEEYGWDLGDCSYFNGIRRVGVDTTIWKINLLTDGGKLF